MPDRPAIGIDLGTSFVRVAVFQNNKVQLIPNHRKNRATPNYLGFIEKRRILGEAVLDEVALGATDTVYNVKRLIGRYYDDLDLSQGQKLWSFDITHELGRTKLEFEREDQKLSYFPEYVTSLMLQYIKDIAEEFLGTTVTDVVISVPTFFNNGQREATKDAGTLAGLNVLRIVSDSLASAITYGLDKQFDVEKYILILDYGGGTIDLSIVAIIDNSFKIIATAGDTNFGGEDLVSRLVEYCLVEYKSAHHVDISSDRNVVHKLRSACEHAKRNLSSTTQTSITVDELIEGIRFETNLTRAQFNEMVRDQFEKVIDMIDLVLTDAGICKTLIHDILLLGGSSRIPILKELITDYFNGKYYNKAINPCETVVYGAAILAAHETNQEAASLKNFQFQEVTPFSLGLETIGGVMTWLAKRNAPIPLEHTHLFTTITDDQPGISINVYEGDRALTKDNRLLGRFEVTGIELAPKGVPQIEVIFRIDANGILHLSAIDKADEKDLSIQCGKGRFAQFEIDLQLEVLSEGQDDHVKQRETECVKRELRSYAHLLKEVANDVNLENFIDLQARTFLNKECDYVLAWMRKNPKEEVQEYVDKQRKLDKIVEPIIMHLYQQTGESIKNS